MISVALKMLSISLRSKIDVNKVVEKMKITTIPNSFKPIPALIRSVGLTLLCKRIIALGGVARRI